MERLNDNIYNFINDIYIHMICIIFILILLSSTLFLFSKREGLDNCDSKPIEGSTEGEITNSNEISNLQNQVNNLDSELRQKVATNTAKIDNINSNIKGLGDLRQIVSGLNVKINQTQETINNLKKKFQEQSSKIANQSK